MMLYPVAMDKLVASTMDDRSTGSACVAAQRQARSFGKAGGENVVLGYHKGSGWGIHDLGGPYQMPHEGRVDEVRGVGNHVLQQQGQRELAQPAASQGHAQAQISKAHLPSLPPCS